MKASRLFIVAILLLLTAKLFCQIKISDIYIGGGYLDSRLIDLNSYLDCYPPNSTIHFDMIRGFTDLNLGLLTSFIKFERFSIDFSLDYLVGQKQQLDFIAFNEFEGIPYDYYIINDDPFSFLDTVVYLYGYRLQTYTFGITPNYKLLSYKWFSIDLGLGLIYYYALLDQDGVRLMSTPTVFRTDTASMISNDWTISWQSNMNFCFNLSNHIFVDAQVKYKLGKIKNLADDYPRWYDSKDYNNEIYPIAQTAIEYNGFNYILRLRYKF